MLKKAIFYLILIVHISACKQFSFPLFTRKTVKIGKQEWMTKNLDVATFRNGDTIPEANTDEKWVKSNKEHTPAWCYYGNDLKLGEKYGKLYNWYAVNDARGIAPKGFHVPSKAEWDVLLETLGGDTIADKKLKSTEGWLEDGNGTNESGFSGLPGGRRDFNGGFGNVGYVSSWWSFTEDGTYDAWNYALLYNSCKVYRFNYDKGFGFFVRCLRD